MTPGAAAHARAEKTSVCRFTDLVGLLIAGGRCAFDRPLCDVLTHHRRCDPERVSAPPVRFTGRPSLRRDGREPGGIAPRMSSAGRRLMATTVPSAARPAPGADDPVEAAFAAAEQGPWRAYGAARRLRRAERRGARQPRRRGGPGAGGDERPASAQRRVDQPRTGPPAARSGTRPNSRPPAPEPSRGSSSTGWRGSASEPIGS
jgi:hypothetical protein